MANFVTRLFDARLGAVVCLPAALCSVLLGVVPAPAHADSISSPPVASRASLRERITYASKRGPVTLLPFDGLPASGRLAGFVGEWSDTIDSSARYEAWRARLTARTPRVDEALAIVLADGDTLRGTFEGVTSELVALRTSTSITATPIPLANVRHVLEGEAEAFGPWSELRPRLAGAPGMTAVRLQRGVAGSVLVSRGRILDVDGGDPPSLGGGSLVLILLVGVVAMLVIRAVAIDNALSQVGAPAP